MSKSFVYINLLILSLFGIVIILMILKEPVVLETQFYVWQRAWSEAVPKAVARATKSADGFMILSGEVDVKEKHLAFHPVAVKWETLANTPVSVTLVIRMRTPVSDLLRQGRVKEVADFLAKQIIGIVEEMQQKPIQVAGIQLDYDCPTAGLMDYRQLLMQLMVRYPHWQWSITTLPTWFNKSVAFKKLVANLDYFVLQVYTFERPSQANLAIINTARIPGYLQQAASVNAPFYLALPTYGYAVVFDEQGHFVGLEAETESYRWPTTYSVQEVRSRPAEIVPVINDLNEHPPQGMLGIVWFRLPVEDDRRNWSWTTLQAVMAGRLPEITYYQVEVRQISQILHEIWVTNADNSEYQGRVQFTVKQIDCRLLARDTLRGYSEKVLNQGEYILTGKVPMAGKQVMVAWYSVNCENTLENNKIFQISQMEALQ
jgi:hypothetical protein